MVEETNDSGLPNSGPITTAGITSTFGTVRKGHLASHTAPFSGMSIIYYRWIAPDDPQAVAHTVHGNESDLSIIGIITIGPKTDAVLDRFGLPDSLIPRLRNMARTVRSNRWAEVLQSPEWGLGYEEALRLSKALSADTGVELAPKVN